MTRPRLPGARAIARGQPPERPGPAVAHRTVFLCFARGLGQILSRLRATESTA